MGSRHRGFGGPGSGLRRRQLGLRTFKGHPEITGVDFHQERSGFDFLVVFDMDRDHRSSDPGRHRIDVPVDLGVIGRFARRLVAIDPERGRAAEDQNQEQDPFCLASAPVFAGPGRRGRISAWRAAFRVHGFVHLIASKKSYEGRLRHPKYLRDPPFGDIVGKQALNI